MMQGTILVLAPPLIVGGDKNHGLSVWCPKMWNEWGQLIQWVIGYNKGDCVCLICLGVNKV